MTTTEALHIDQLTDTGLVATLYSVDDQELQVTQLVDVESIPELSSVRLMARQEANEILALNRKLVAEGRAESVPIPVDPLGTARRVVELKQEHGVESPEFKDVFEGLLLDCERLIGEAVRKTTFEIFGKTKQKFEQATENYFSHGVAVLGITRNGLSPMAKPEEIDIRVNDHIAEHTNHAIPQLRVLGHLATQESVTLRAISECADWAIEAYKADHKSAHGGYVPEIEKLMVRDLTFDPSNDRQQEQVALSGMYITHSVITTVLQKRGALPEGQTLTKTELHAKQFIAKEGIMKFVADLDEEASIVSGKNIFMGEEVPTDYLKDYDTAIKEAEERRRKLIPMPNQLAEYLIFLQENRTDRLVSEALVDKFLKDMLLKVAKSNPEQAAIIFDQATADGLKEVSRLEDLGLYEEARSLELIVEENAPDVSYCGAGSCGLESVEETNNDAKTVRDLGLKGQLIHDTVRTCVSCQEMKVYYDQYGNKACAGCGYKQINGVLSRSVDKD